MACQMDPNVYGFMCRCPMRNEMHRRSLLRREPRRRRPEGRDSGCAKLKQLADAAEMTLSGYLAQMIAERVEDVELEEYLNAWMDDQYQRNLKLRDLGY